MEHYYSEEQKAPLNMRRIRQNIRGMKFQFYTASGIFSKSKVDKGTLVLAENMLVRKNSKVLDMGCGIGILGIAAARLFDANVVMADINKRAVMLARKNTELNEVKAEIYQGNLYENIRQGDFDVVLSNPPQNAGKETCFRLIEGSRQHLKDKGSLQIVARHNKGGRSLSEKMQEVFGNVDALAKVSGYWAYMSIKN